MLIPDLYRVDRFGGCLLRVAECLGLFRSSDEEGVVVKRGDGVQWAINKRESRIPVMIPVLTMSQANNLFHRIIALPVQPGPDFRQ